VCRCLGEGQFGKVYMVRSNVTNEIKAMKAIKRKSLLKIGKKGNIMFEIKVLMKLSHINIVKLEEVIDDPKNSKIYLIMDYLSGGTLASKLELEKFY